MFLRGRRSLKTTQFVLTALLGFFALSIPASAQTIEVDISQPTNHFVPKESLGAGSIVLPSRPSTKI
jgi:hypothetical protein